MTSAFHRLLHRLMGATFALCLGLILLLSPFGLRAEAGRSSMSGDYVNDTVSVARNLRDIVSIPNDDEKRSEVAELPSASQLSRMKKAELVDLAKERGVAHSGTKATIIDRLTEEE